MPSRRFCATAGRARLLCFVHNAGQHYDALAAMMAQDKAEAAMQVNFFAFARLCIIADARHDPRAAPGASSASARWRRSTATRAMPPMRRQRAR